MTDLPSPATSVRASDLPSAYNLTVIGLLAILAGLGMGYFINALSEAPRTAPVSEFAAPFVDVNIAGAPLNIPQDWLRNQNMATGGFADQVDLLLTLDFGTRAPETLGLLLTPHSRAQSSAYLLDKVYLHLFMAEQVSGPAGLIGKPLRGDDGFEGETVWYDPLSPMPFVAKCQAAPVPDEPDLCMRTVRLTDGLSVTYSFHETLLFDWPAFDETTRAVLEQIGALDPI